MAAVILEDFIKPYRKTPFTPRGADILMKFTVIFMGILCVGLVFVVEKTGSHVLQVIIYMYFFLFYPQGLLINFNFYSCRQV